MSDNQSKTYRRWNFKDYPPNMRTPDTCATCKHCDPYHEYRAVAWSYKCALYPSVDVPLIYADAKVCDSFVDKNPPLTPDDKSITMEE